jgi:hypothetical protein
MRTEREQRKLINALHILSSCGPFSHDDADAALNTMITKERFNSVSLHFLQSAVMHLGLSDVLATTPTGWTPKPIPEKAKSALGIE